MSQPHERRPGSMIERDAGEDPMATADGERSLQVAVSPLRRRRRLPDRAVIAALVAGTLVALAVAKPWQAEPADLDTTDPGPSTPVAVGTPAPVPETPAPVAAITIHPIELPTWPTIATAMSPRTDWGIRVLTDASRPTTERPRVGVVPLADGGGLVERWYAAGEPPPAGPPGRLERRAGLQRLVVIGATEAPVRLIALTSPVDEAPLDVRLWRLSVGQLERLDGGRPDGDLGIGDWFFAPPTVDGSPLAAWPAGWYRLDVLTPDGVSRIGLRIDRGPATPDGWSLPAPDPTEGAVAADDRPEPVDRGLDRQPSRPEAIMVRGSEVVGLPVHLGEPLDEWRSWLSVGVGEGPIALPRAASIGLTDVMGFGLRFPDGATETNLVATSLIGPGRPREATRWGVHEGVFGGSPWAIVDAHPGESWPPGVYRLDARWRDASGDIRRAAYHVDVLAGRVTPTPAMLGTTRAWSRDVGSSGVASAAAGPLRLPSFDGEVGSPSPPPFATPSDAARLDADCATGEGLAGSRSPVGVVVPRPVAVRSVRVATVGAGADPTSVPVRAAIEPLPGLVLLAPEAADGWKPGRYSVTLDTGTGSLDYGLCVD